MKKKNFRLIPDKEFTKPLPEQEITPVEAAPATNGNANADAPKKSNKFAAVFAVIAALVLGIGGFIAYKEYQRRNDIYVKLAAEWDEEYAGTEAYYMVMNDNGEYLLITDVDSDNVVLAEGKIPSTPDWLAEGTAEALNGKDTEQAKFAAKYHTLKKSDNREEILVLGIGMFEHPDRFNPTQAAQCQESMIWHLVN